jgi:hypothetical protein
MIGATNDSSHFRQKRGQRSYRRRFSGSPVTECKDAADRRVHGCDQEGQFHLFLSDNRREGKRPPHLPKPYSGLIEGYNCYVSTFAVSIEIAWFSQLSDLSNMSPETCQFNLSEGSSVGTCQSIRCKHRCVYRFAREPAYGQRAIGGMDERMEAMLPPVLSPKIVPRS